MRKIKLTREKFALVDNEDYNKLNAHKWYCVKTKYTFYAERSIHIGNKKHINIRMHRQIFGLANTDKRQIDHINEDGLNNQKNNLRICTHAQNKRNVTKRNNNTLSKFKGVTQHKRDKRWMAQIRFNYRNIFLGYFNDELTAAIAYNNAAKKYHGEFANLNKV